MPPSAATAAASRRLPPSAFDRSVIPTAWPTNRWPWGRLPARSLAQVGDEAQQLEVQPHERHHEAECSDPLVGLRQAGVDAPFDEVEVERQVGRSETTHQHRESDAEGHVVAVE